MIREATHKDIPRLVEMGGRFIRRYTDDPADAAHVNGILNHPDILPWINFNDDPLDFTWALGQPDRYVLFGPYGGQVYHLVGPDTYEVHSAYLPEARGQLALATTRATLEWMFSRTDATEILTRVPRGNVAAKALARACGLRHTTIMPEGFMRYGKTIPCDVMSLTVQDWKARTERDNTCQ
jgi:RimJ/RimL family protein N-acetyltransferase